MVRTHQIELRDTKKSHEKFLGSVEFDSFHIEFLITNCYSKFDKHGKHG
jgi:hypothetical protein